ncbi:transmembrane domain-containing protein TMIGD3-like [Xyrichtys novacula]|uniref:Transmembrane domain-containing protein TMIGD3-like n=1 Tax=Xyrichtys novacula TaxID=13765 RepID=A0AAV1EXB8_XYRNO|nr:transmembrane domain-containing protein TMIGD3-like [Xyrichtys novacula]
MGKTSLIVIFLLGGLWETSAQQVTAVAGKKTTITCSHSYASSNIKYFCKGACHDKDVLISSRNSKIQDSNKKYSIRDEGNTFYVTIFNLKEDDSGTYWCGIERKGLDTYNKVVLTVVRGEENNVDDSMPQSSDEIADTETTSSRKLIYIGAGLGVVVLALAVVLLIFFRHRNRNIRASSGKVQETVYATMSGEVTTFSATNPGTADTSKDPTKNIYTNVSISSEPQVQPDSLFYSTVSFNKHTDCSTVTPCTAEVTYSAVERKPEDTAPVYSNI